MEPFVWILQYLQERHEKSLGWFKGYLKHSSGLIPTCCANPLLRIWLIQMMQANSELLYRDLMANLLLVRVLASELKPGSVARS
jgi:hypothetical protein